MERLTGIEIRVCEEAAELGSPYERVLVGEQATEWMRDHHRFSDDPRVEQERAREMSLVLMAARDNQADRDCQRPDCESCQVFERGFGWLLGTLPRSYQRAIQEYRVLRMVSDLPLRVRHH